MNNPTVRIFTRNRELDLLNDYRTMGEAERDKIIAEAVDNNDIPSDYTGWAKLMYDNGQIKWLAQWKDGKRDGLATSWDENGQKEREGNWKEDIEDGLFSWYEDNGEKRLEKIYKDGKVDGLATSWYENGQKKRESSWKDGKLMSAKVWKPSGEKCPVTNVEDGNGVMVWYLEDGTVSRRDSWKDGKRDGILIYYNEDGIEWYRRTYKDGEPFEEEQSSKEELEELLVKPLPVASPI